MTLKQIQFKIKHWRYFIGYRLNIKGYRGSGLKLKKPDERNYTHADMFVGGWLVGYTPQKVRKVLPGISDAWNQGGNYCCQWYATSKAKEIYEKVALSVKSLVTWGYRKGLTGSNGLSSMDAGEKGLKNYGIMEEKDMPSSSNYNDLISGAIDKNKAAEHKSSAYIQLKSVDEIYKMIDEGRPVKIGLPWYSGWNAGSGRDLHWLIDNTYGVYGGGHCMYIPSYDTQFRVYNYDGFGYQNSYGKDWGTIISDDDGNSFNGAGFITKKQLERLGQRFGFFVNFDVETSLDLTASQILERFDGMNVRGNKNGAIYMIIGGGYRAAYISDKAFLSINGFPYTKPNSFTIVKQEELDMIPLIGDGILTGDLGQFKELVDGLKEPVNNNFQY